VSELPDPPAQPGLPTDDLVQAIAIGRAELSDALLLSLSRRVSRETITQGWLGDLYDCEVGRSMSRLQLAMGRGGGVINPDSDTPHAPNGGRAQLIDELRSEVIQREARADAHRRVAEFCAEVDPQEVFDQVIPLHNGTAASAQPIMEFLADLLPTDAHPEPFATSSWTSKAQTKELHYVDQTTCWSPPALQRTAVGAHRVIVKTTESTTTASGSYVVKTIRVDQSKVTSLEDFAIFAARTLELAVPAVSEGKMY
jgi:hypothetical protein